MLKTFCITDKVSNFIMAEYLAELSNLKELHVLIFKNTSVPHSVFSRITGA